MTRSSSAWPSDASVSFLSDVLEAAPPVEVLFEPEGVRWDPTPSREKRKELAAAAGRGPACAGFKYSAGSAASSVGFEEENSNTLTADWHAPAVIELAQNTRDGCLNPQDPQSKRVFLPSACAPTLSSETSEGMSIQPSVLVPDEPVVCMTDTQANAGHEEEVCGTLTSHAMKDAPVVAHGDGRQNE